MALCVRLFRLFRSFVKKNYCLNDQADNCLIHLQDNSQCTGILDQNIVPNIEPNIDHNIEPNI